ncbi:MAG: molybdopterin molybdenumtransferase MoeA, partial [Nitrospiraceae bacterium]|nr:molybdopterin molybdenumtransferase MoeA [Nitrospiraceae bacterium]
MIPFCEALRTVIANTHVLDSEHVALASCAGRVLAEDVVSDVDMPPFNKSAMDGYACRRTDLAHPLAVLEVIKAGSPPTRPIGPDECSKIMTGAMVPEGADCVIMVEHTETAGDGSVRFTGKSTRDNICFQREDVQTGDVILRAGTLVAPQHIAMLAAVGCVKPRVAQRPRVAVIATGDELVEPHVKPRRSQIRTTNGAQLCAQIQRTRTTSVYYGIVGDTEEATDTAVKRAMAQTDVILLSGGVSMGDFDFVPDVLRSNGIEILFDAVAMKPGKPTVFGVSTQDAPTRTYCVGLPGNPVATFCLFELLVKPLLYGLMGHTYQPVEFTMPLATPLQRKRAEREAWMPATLTGDGRAVPCEFHGSAHIAALSN